ncbi:MAG: Gx transporter family protein [Halanaerobiales bacterium]
MFDNRNSLQKSVIIGLLVSIGLILHVVEGMLPMNAVVPGAKLGLANISNLLGLFLFGFQAGLQILILRIVLGSLLAGTFMTINFYFSLSGGLLGFLAMAVVYYCLSSCFSIIGVSVVGSVFHNLGQVLIAYFIIVSGGIFYYLPFLLLLAVPTGLGVGLVSYFTLNYLPEEGVYA